MTSIYTRQGDTIDLANPSGFAFSVPSIAHALSRIARFTGHIDRDDDDFSYSVAQHSVMVSKLLPPEFALEGLMHDAQEAFVGDVSTPLKNMVGDAYRNIEDRVYEAIAERFSLPKAMTPIVKDADRLALRAEQRDLFPDDGRLKRANSDVLVDPIKTLTPDQARREFIEHFIEIAGVDRYEANLIDSYRVIARAVDLVSERKGIVPVGAAAHTGMDAAILVSLYTPSHSVMAAAIARPLLEDGSLSLVDSARLLGERVTRIATDANQIYANPASSTDASRSAQLIVSCDVALGRKNIENYSVDFFNTNKKIQDKAGKIQGLFVSMDNSITRLEYKAVDLARARATMRG